jgi:type I restriction enzyme S subunit
MDRFSKGITDFRKRLYWDEFKQLTTLLPPIEEQIEIAEYLDSLNAQISDLAAKIEHQIESLKSFKASLITSVVTGKIKV